MNEIAFVVGVGIFLAYLLYITFNLSNEHIYLKYLLLFVFLGLVLLIPKSLMDNSDYCEMRVNSTDIIGNTTNYDYGLYCFETTNNNGYIFFSQVMGIVSIIGMYFLVYWFKKIFGNNEYMK